MSSQVSSADETQVRSGGRSEPTAPPSSDRPSSDDTVASPGLGRSGSAGAPPSRHERDLINLARGQVSAIPDPAQAGSPVSSGTPQDAESGGPQPTVAGIPQDAFEGYRLIRKIHGGGQGVVFQAQQLATGKKVALKVVREGPFADPRNRARLERGIRILAQLDHPHIVGIIDSGLANGTLYYVMDYIPGCSLDEFVERARTTSYNEAVSGSQATTSQRPGRKTATGSSRRQKADIRDLLKLFVQICEAVNAAHLRGIIHRDLKPGNIRIDEKGQPHILDFDLAKVVAGGALDEDQQYINTQTGEFIGSLRWASPEQVERRPNQIDMRTDVYSLGVVLFEMLTAQYPYPVVGTRREIEDHILQTAPTRPSTIRRQIDNDVETILLTCLAKERHRRYQNAGALAEDIQRYLSGDAIAAKRDSPLYVLRKVASRNAMATALVAAVLVTIISSFSAVAFVWGQWQSDRKRQLEDTRKVTAHDDQVERGFETMTLRAGAGAAMAWFLAEWEAGRVESAKRFLNWLPNRTGSASQPGIEPVPERAAMRFLLNPSMSVAEFRAQMPTPYEALFHLAVGERLAKAGRLEEAAREFRNGSTFASDGMWGPGLYAAVASQRLKDLRAAIENSPALERRSTGPTASGPATP